MTFLLGVTLFSTDFSFENQGYGPHWYSFYIFFNDKEYSL